MHDSNICIFQYHAWQSKLELDIEELKSQLKQAWSVINDLAAKCDGLQKEVMLLKQSTRKTARKQTVVTKESVVDMERNVKELRTLSCTQVSKIQKHMYTCRKISHALHIVVSSSNSTLASYWL